MRQVQRLKTLQLEGLTSMQALEDAEVCRNNAPRDLVAARARQQLRRTEVQAPFDGVLSECKVSLDGTTQVAKALVKVIDPRSMRFEGLVPARGRHDHRLPAALLRDETGELGHAAARDDRRLTAEFRSLGRLKAEKRA